MKVIDLLNKIANGEEVPRKIKYYDEYYILNEDTTSIENLYLIDGARVGWFNHNNFSLNSQVKIIEEQQDIDIQGIEEIEEGYAYICGENARAWSSSELIIVEKINELVQAVKQLNKKIKE